MRVTSGSRVRRWLVASTIAATIGAIDPIGVGAAAQDRRLVDAAKRNEAATVRALLAEGVDVNAVGVDGTSPLQWAVHHEDVALVAHLLRAGAQANAANRYGVKPLSIASTNANVAIIEALLTAGADPNTSQPEGETALMTAARTGSAEIVKLLIARGADVNALESWRGQTALMWAASEGHAAVVRLLVAHGADIRARSILPQRSGVRGPPGGRPGGMTPILFAVRGGHIATTLALLQAGASVNEQAPSGNSLLHLAIVNAHFELAAALVKAGADTNALGPLPDTFTPLHLLVQVRRPAWTTKPSPVPSGNLDSLDLMKALVAHGARIDAPLPPPQPRRADPDDESVPPPGEGATPLWLAARGPDPDAMRTLIAMGADPLAKTQDGVTVLMTAAGLGYRQGPRETLEADVLESVKIALEHKGDVLAADAQGNTALHGAALRGANSTVLLLLDRGAKIDAKNQKGQTPLHIAEDASDVRSQPVTAALLRKLMNDRVGAQ